MFENIAALFSFRQADGSRQLQVQLHCRVLLPFSGEKNQCALLAPPQRVGSVRIIYCCFRSSAKLPQVSSDPWVHDGPNLGRSPRVRVLEKWSSRRFWFAPYVLGYDRNQSFRRSYLRGQKNYSAIAIKVCSRPLCLCNLPTHSRQTSHIHLPWDVI